MGVKKSQRISKRDFAISKGNKTHVRVNKRNFKQAEYVTDDELKLLWREMIDSKKPKVVEAVMAFSLCYTTGARMGEALSLKYEDAVFKRDEGGKFICFHIRSSKTDPFCKRMEALNLTLSVPHVVPIDLKLQEMFDKNSKGNGLYFSKFFEIFKALSSKS